MSHAGLILGLPELEVERVDPNMLTVVPVTASKARSPSSNLLHL
jgi:hypothetical protein